MSLQAVVFGALAFLIGAALAFQAPINTLASARLGHPLVGATFSFIVGTIFLAGATLLFVREPVDWGSIRSLPPLLWLGGLLGAFYIGTAIVLTPKIGVGALVALVIAGQVGASLMLDHYGLLGLTVHEISFGRAIGALMVVGGALMVRFL